jgi:hypothetical protein
MQAEDNEKELNDWVNKTERYNVEVSGEQGIAIRKQKHIAKYKES